MICKAILTLAVAALLFMPAAARADTTTIPSAAPMPPTPTAAEAPFVTKATIDLNKLYPTPKSAEDAGYKRFTDEDSSGSISYANGNWTSSDADHPSQLWYSVDGRLLGADYSVPYAAERPTLFGIDPSRWIRIGAHVHYGLVGPNETTIYGGTGGPKWAAAGGSLTAPTAAQLVNAGIAKNASDVRFVFPFPAIWDLQIWVLPNPNGAFADKNPNVVPSHPQGMNM